MPRLHYEQWIEQIKAAQQFAQLRALRDELHRQFQLREGTDHAEEWHFAINAWHDALIQKAVSLSEQELFCSGGGTPPLRYAFVLFGSGGRKEQTLWSDQDNGLIYEDADGAIISKAEIYFQRLSDYIHRNLKFLGYPPCSGNVLCTNSLWRKPLSHWRQMIDLWIEEPVWEHIRYLLVLADVRCIYGERNLTAEVVRHFYSTIGNDPVHLQIMLQNTLHHRIWLGPFGRLITERYGEDAGGIDIKYGAYIPMVNGIRLLSVRSGLYATSTIERISELMSHDPQMRPVLEKWLKAFNSVLKFRLATPFRQDQGMYTSRGFLPLQHLSFEQRDELKDCLRMGASLQKYVKKNVQREIKREEREQLP